MDYFLLKTIHILAATVLFGTGIGTAFSLWMTHRRGDVAAIAVAAGNVVLADWLFTTPAMLIQPLTGFWLLHRMGIAWTTSWVMVSLALYVLAAACWLPVVVIQYRVRDLAAAAQRDHKPLPAAYFRLMRWWFALGWPAFLALVAVFWLMVRKSVG